MKISADTTEIIGHTPLVNLTIYPNGGRTHKPKLLGLGLGLHHNFVELNRCIGAGENGLKGRNRLLQVSQGARTPRAGGQVKGQQFDGEGAR